MKRQDHEYADDPPVIPSEPLLLTLRQAADLCQVGLDRMREWSYEPGFPVIRTAQQVRIPPDELKSWLKRRARGGVLA